ncbi:MAG: type II secretion system protein F [Streptosporangiales bacterium]|nr:type II secretion system protein F [Streptosporangiales bacterium]
MGALVGLTFGLGAVLVFLGLTTPPPAPRVRRHSRTAELLAQAGIEGVTPRQFVAASVVLGVVGGLGMLALSRAWVVALAFAGIAALAPRALVSMRRRRRSTELRELWPEVVDNLASAVRAGMSLPEAVAGLATRGPETLRPPFLRFAEDYRATGRFDDCLDRLKERLADPVGDSVAESLRVARAVGGGELGTLLRTLSGFLRENARTRGELESRQSWTVNAARLAVAAPWMLLGLLALRPEAVAAYDSAAGAVVLGTGAGVSIVAYRLMLRIARLPEERRVLR